MSKEELEKLEREKYVFFFALFNLRNLLYII